MSRLYSDRTYGCVTWSHGEPPRVSTLRVIRVLGFVVWKERNDG